MFSKAIKLIESKSYDEATTLLHSLSHTDDAKVTAKANYLIGYINTRWDNEDKDTLLAQRSLLANINSEFPLPHAYVLYANISDDINVAINYLKKGIQRFPKEQELYKALLHLSNSKDAVIEEIQNQGLCDALLLGDVISYLITIQLACIRVEFAGRQLVHREAEHVCRAVHITELPIHTVNALVVCQYNAYYARHIHALRVKRHVDRLFDAGSRIVVAEVSDLAAYTYIVFHLYFLLNFFGGSFPAGSAGFFLS